MTKKAIYSIVGGLVIIAIILIAIFSGSSTSSGKETVTIGVTLPLSGDVAFLGIPEQNAVKMAQEDFMQNKKFDYKIVIEDDAYDAKKVATNMQKFVSIDNADVVLTFGSLAANVVAPVAEENKVVFVAASASDTSVADGYYGFDFTTTPQKEAEKMAEELKKRGYTKVALIRENGEASEAIMKATRNELMKNSIEIVAEDVFNTGDTDFKTGLLKIKESDAQISLIFTVPPSLELLAKQYKDLNIEIPMTAIESFGLTEEKGLFEGQWYIDANYPSEEFFAKYKAKYGEDPSPYAADVYSILEMVVSSYEQSDQKISHEDLVEKLMSIQNFDTYFGKVSVNDKGVFETPATLKKIENGEAVLI